MSSVYLLIPLLPLLASIIIALAGWRLGEESRKVGVLAIGISFALSVAAFVQVVLQRDPIVIPLYELLHSGSLTVEFGLYIDQLTVLLLLLVTGVSFVVHVYSASYMIGDAQYSRFFAVMALFTFGMVTLVMSSNLLMMFMCWEVMGICSYLLISHQADRKAACQAATKAFLVNAVADVGLLFGIILTFSTFQTLDVQQILSQAENVSGQTINLLEWVGLEWNVRRVTLITLFLFMGCLGKSAQVPFHVWLPNAMEAPTPVSALIHAATMVNAGPYLLVRFSDLVKLSPAAMAVIVIVGATTALFAAIVSLTQSDIKKILAYSTISQIGFMIMTCGLGAFVVAIFHMLAHGFLKGFLFLSTGNQLASAGSHGHHEPTAVRPKPPPLLYLGALILACVPPLLIFSGPYEALWTEHNSNAARIAFWVIGLLTVFFTAMYLFRGIASLFQRVPSEVVQPRFFSPFHLVGIIVGSVGLIVILLALWVWFVPFLAPATATPYPLANGNWSASHFPSLALALVAALAGWGLASVLHARSMLSFVPHSKWAQTMYVLFLNKFYFDEIYSFYIVQPTLRFVTWLWREVDVGGINCLIHGIATTSVRVARWLWRVVDVRGVDRAVVESGTQSVGLARWLWEAVDVRRIEKASDQIGRAANASGKKLNDVEPRTIQHHLVVLIGWLVVAILFFYWLVL
ncbi:MAG: NADH-quinone oxidoreductase subunit L [Planctomycetota bacterium]|nr:NADH-quinone oxidoreductase subunit L [Planctomycetota bacterium]